jgi:hypothetical protein
MNILDPVVCRELPVIQKIIADETWLEGERRGCWVPPDDPVVRENVCQVILRIGAALREALLGRAETGALVPVEQMPSDHHPHAA